MQDARPGVAGRCLFSLGNWRFVTLKKKKKSWGGGREGVQLSFVPMAL